MDVAAVSRKETFIQCLQLVSEYTKHNSSFSFAPTLEPSSHGFNAPNELNKSQTAYDSSTGFSKQHSRMVLSDSQQATAAEQHHMSNCSFSFPRAQLCTALLSRVSRENKTRTRATAEALMASRCQAGDREGSGE